MSSRPREPPAPAPPRRFKEPREPQPPAAQRHEEQRPAGTMRSRTLLAALCLSLLPVSAAYFGSALPAVPPRSLRRPWAPAPAPWVGRVGFGALRWAPRVDGTAGTPESSRLG